MIDTVGICIDGPPREGLLGALSSVRETYDREREMCTLTGFLGNLKATVRPYETYIQGSVSRYLHGTNLADMTWGDVRAGMDKMESVMGLFRHEARVYRLDVGANLRMEHPAAEVLAVCGRAGRYEKRPYRTGLEYHLQRRSLLLYDKIEEVQARGETVIEKVREAHILRCEVQFKNRLKDQLGQEVFASTLCEPNFQRRMTGRWKKELDSIRLKRTVQFRETVGTKDVFDYFAARGIEQAGGVEACMAMLEPIKRSSEAGRQRYYRAHRKARRLMQREALTEATEAGAELRRKVAEKARMAEDS